MVNAKMQLQQGKEGVKVVYLNFLNMLGENHQIFVLSIRRIFRQRDREKNDISGREQAYTEARDVQKSVMFWKIEPFMHSCDRGLCEEVAIMKQNILLESDS